MKLIKLCYDDAELFETALTSARRDFIVNHFEAFMQMYKTQGPTFWLRFLLCFKKHCEEKISSNKIWITNIHEYYLWVMNYIHMILHKRFLEDNNIAVKTFIHNLINLALNSPSHLNYSCEQWLFYVKHSKQLRSIFKRFFKVSESVEFLEGFQAFLFTVYTEFFCALCAVFEQWCKVNDLSEEELKKLDSEIIYWLPTFATEKKFKPTCFDKYVSDYWKENLQRMLLTDSIHELFSSHVSIGCCENFVKVKDIWKIVKVSDTGAIELMKVLNNGDEKDVNAKSLKTCACCKNEETEIKTFKSCAILTEKQCPLQHYYCSPECFKKDWSEKHEYEHIRFSRQSR